MKKLTFYDDSQPTTATSGTTPIGFNEKQKQTEQWFDVNKAFLQFGSGTENAIGLFDGMTVSQMVEWLDKRCNFNDHQKDYVHLMIQKIIKAKLTAHDPAL